jgi:hypothetical protein
VRAVKQQREMNVTFKLPDFTRQEVRVDPLFPFSKFKRYKKTEFTQSKGFLFVHKSHGMLAEKLLLTMVVIGIVLILFSLAFLFVL